LAFRRSNAPSTGQARGVGEQDYEQHDPEALTILLEARAKMARGE